MKRRLVSECQRQRSHFTGRTAVTVHWPLLFWPPDCNFILRADRESEEGREGGRAVKSTVAKSRELMRLSSFPLPLSLSLSLKGRKEGGREGTHLASFLLVCLPSVSPSVSVSLGASICDVQTHSLSFT